MARSAIIARSRWQACSHPARQIAVTQLSSDPDTWKDVQANSFWSYVAIVLRTGGSGASECVAQYTLAK